MRKDNGPGTIRERRFQLRNVDIVSWYLNVDEYRHQAALDDGIYGCGKAGGDGDYLVSGHQSARPQPRGR